MTVNGIDRDAVAPVWNALGSTVSVAVVVAIAVSVGFAAFQLAAGGRDGRGRWLLPLVLFDLGAAMFGAAIIAPQPAVFQELWADLPAIGAAVAFAAVPATVFALLWTQAQSVSTKVTSGVRSASMNANSFPASAATAA